MFKNQVNQLTNGVIEIICDYINNSSLFEKNVGITEVKKYDIVFSDCKGYDVVKIDESNQNTKFEIKLSDFSYAIKCTIEYQYKRNRNVSGLFPVIVDVTSYASNITDKAILKKIKYALTEINKHSVLALNSRNVFEATILNFKFNFVDLRQVCSGKELFERINKKDKSRRFIIN